MLRTGLGKAGSGPPGRAQKSADLPLGQVTGLVSKGRDFSAAGSSLGLKRAKAASR